MGIELSRDHEGQLVPMEPLFLWWSERDTASAKKYGPQYAQPDIWKCRDHPTWQGEDIPESLFARFGEPTFWPNKTRAQHREIWEQVSIQAHADLHGFTTAEP